MILNFNVNNQELTFSKKESLANKSNKILKCSFDFNGEDWEDKQIFALLFNSKREVYQLHVEDDMIIIPATITIGNKFKLSLYGEDLTAARITTNMVTISLKESGYTTDIEDLEDIDPDIWTQIFTAIDGKAEIIHVHNVSDITDFPNLSEVATSGDYNDLENKPSIPSRTSDLTNDGDDGVNCFVKNNDTRLSDTRDPKPHNHSKDEIIDFPEVMPPTSHTHKKNEITDFPATMPPSSHTHSKSEITDFQHSHTTNDISDFPEIPSKISDLTNDSDFIETSDTTGLVKNDGSIDTNDYALIQTLEDYVEKSSTAGLIKNDGTIDTTQYLSNADFSNYIQKSDTSGLVKNDGTIDTTPYISEHQSLDDCVKKSNTVGLLKNDGTVDTTTYINTNDSRLSDARTPTSHTHTKSEISDFPSSMTPSAHNQASSTITNNAAFDNILAGESTTLTLTDQDKINAAINTILGVIKGTKFIEITNDKGTASASTMGKLYIVNENSKVNVYYSFEDNGVYDWEKMDADILDELIINWSDIKNKPSTYTPSAHEHTTSDISNFPSLANVATSGSYTDLSNKPTIPVDVSDLTDTQNTAFTPKSHTHTKSEISDFPTLANVATSGSYADLSNKPSIPSKTSELTNDGDGTNVFVKNNDSRLSDARTPTTHTHTKSEITDFPSLSTVATSGSYNDLDNKPSIPSKTSDLDNDSGFLTSHNPIDNALSGSSENAVQNKVINTALSNKVDKVSGKQLSTEDYTTAEKNKLSVLSNYSHPSEKQCSYAYTHPSAKQCNVAIPTDTSDLTNSAGFITSSDISGKVNVTDIVDDLVSSDTDKPLSANQGKELAEMIGDIQTYVNR